MIATQVRRRPWATAAALALFAATETRRTRRGGKSTSYYYICEKKSGGSVKVPVNNAVAQAAAPIILQEASARGIPVRDETGEQ